MTGLGRSETLQWFGKGLTSAAAQSKRNDK